jgi:hypothetical protein
MTVARMNRYGVGRVLQYLGSLLSFFPGLPSLVPDGKGSLSYGGQ